LATVAAFAADSFWTLQGAERATAANAFFEHISIVAGFVLAAMIANRQAQTKFPITV
jgi:uncharacterized membrane protein YphA (DoxX/SURF4 family)